MKKKVLSILLCLCLVCMTPFTVAFAETGDTACEITIVHTNDIHGYYTSTKYGAIGFAYLKSLINEQNADLVLDIGDAFHGQSFATVEQGKSIAELMRQVGYDAVTVGNHDWSYGANRLKELENIGGFSILASNVVTDGGDDFFDMPYLVKDITTDDGASVRVGIVGVIDDNFYNSTASDNVAGLCFKEEAAEATAAAQKLRDVENCDIVIAITHQSAPGGFVENIRGIDAVIAGHQHILIDDVYADADGKGVAVVEAGSFFNCVGVLTLKVDPNEKTLIGTQEAVYTAGDFSALTQDTATAEKIAEIENREKAVLDTSVGFSEEEYAYSWEEIRVAEQAIGRIVTSAYLDRTGADVAMENAGGIRAGIPKGDVTYGDIIGISPYGNVLVTKKLTGKQILNIVEYSLEISRQCDEVYALQKQAVEKGEDPYQYEWPDNSGSVLQFGGISVKYDMSKPEGSRIVSAEIGGKAVIADKEYVVATNSYVAESSEYSGVSQARLLKEYGTCEEALKSYIGKNDFEKAANTANLLPVDSEEETSEPKTQPETSTEISTNASTTASPNTTTSASKAASNSPDTGSDDSDMWLYSIMMLISAGILMSELTLKLRKATRR